MHKQQIGEKLLQSVLGSFIRRSERILFYCPDCNHHKPKLSFHVDMNAGKCWVCDKRGTITQYLKRFGTNEHVSQWLGVHKQHSIKKNIDEKHIVLLPEEIKPLSEKSKSPYYQTAYNYLKQRQVDDYMIERYNLGYCEGGKYVNRVIFPSYDINGNLNFFTSRAVYDDMTLKYLMPSGNKQLIIFNELFINFSSPVILTEGPLDAIRIENAVPLLGSTLPKESLLFKRLIKYKPLVYLGLDKDALAKSVKIASLLEKWNVATAHVDLKNWNDLAEVPTEMLQEVFSSPTTGSFKNNLTLRLS